MRRRGEIGQRHGATGKPFPRLRQPAEIFQVIAHGEIAGAHRCASGLPRPVIRFMTFSPSRLRVASAANLPSNQATSRRASTRSASVRPSSGRVGIGFLEVFADDTGIGDRKPIVLDQRRHGAGRIEFQIFSAPFPGLFRSQIERQAFLRENQAHLAGVWRQRQMIQRSHRRCLWHRAPRRAKRLATSVFGLK